MVTMKGFKFESAILKNAANYKITTSVYSNQLLLQGWDFTHIYSEAPN